MGIEPMPEMSTTTFEGAQPPVSLKVTEKAKLVDGCPFFGEADPSVRLGVWEAPLQLAALTCVVGPETTATAANMTAATKLAGQRRRSGRGDRAIDGPMLRRGNPLCSRSDRSSDAS